MTSASRANTPVSLVCSSAVLCEVIGFACVLSRVCSKTDSLSFRVSKPFGSTVGDGATSSKLSLRAGGHLIVPSNLGDTVLSFLVVTVSVRFSSEGRSMIIPAEFTKSAGLESITSWTFENISYPCLKSLSDSGVSTFSTSNSTC